MASKKKFLWLLAVPAAAALALVGATATGQSAPQTSPSTGMGEMANTPGSGMMTTPMGGKMMAHMEESDRRLDELVSTMNSATGSARVDAIAAVVNELVAQHRQMHQHMMSGRSGMRGGMRMMGAPGATSTTPGASTTPRARRRTGTTSPALSPTPMP